MPRVALHTLGCKLNYAETSALGQQFLARGYEIVELGQPADVCVINTCSVTERADRECRRLIRRALRTAGRPFVIVTGCYAQLEPEAIASIDGVDLVLGSREKFALFEHAGDLTRGGGPRVAVSDVAQHEDFGPAASTDAADRTRAYLKVQDGCDYGCAFCTIPLARGASRSQTVGACLAQARDLVARGYREVVLTGVNVGHYGRKTGGSLLELLRALVRVDGLERLRISSVEPNLLHDELIAFVAEQPKMCPHFHIPLQSGADPVLRGMRRRYTAAQYRALLERVRSLVPDAGIGADVIVGFPGETGEHFDATHRLLADLPVTYLHVFTYSERPNTPAASFGGHVEPAERARRSAELRVLGQKKRHAFHRSMVGRTLQVLTESRIEGGRRYGLTGNYVRVGLPADTAPENAVLPVTITSADAEGCLGEACLGEARLVEARLGGASPGGARRS